MHQCKYNDNRGSRVSRSMWEIFDSILLEQKLPSVFHRNVRSIVKYHKHFKASEIVVFLLYTSRLTKYLFTSDVYYKHHLLLVDALHRILQMSHSIVELDAIHRQLISYVIEFQHIYGIKYVTLNIHMLTHLVMCVKMHGPLVGYSTFPFEGFNKLLLGSIHGTNRVERGIAEAIPLIQLLEERLREVQEKSVVKVLQKLSVCSFITVLWLCCSRWITNEMHLLLMLWLLLMLVMVMVVMMVHQGGCERWNWFTEYDGTCCCCCCCW